MQQVHWHKEARRIALVAGTGLALGWSLGYPLWGGILGLMATIAMLMNSMLSFYRWLHQQSLPPEEGLLGYSADLITRREKALNNHISQQKNQLQRYSQGLEALHDGVIIMNADGYILQFNRAAKKFLNLRNQDRGQQITNLVRNPRFSHYLKGKDGKDSVQLDVRHKLNLSLLIQITDFGLEQKLMLVRDITERKRIESMRQNFIANASHELRTPLTVINGYVEILQDSDLPSAQQKIFQQMHEQSLRMKYLIDDLIQLSKLESSRDESEGEWFDFKHLAFVVLDQIASVSQGRVQFSCDQEIDMLGFSGEMHSVLSNLLMNAIKYAPAGKIIFTAHVSLNGLKVSVKDNGPGIAAEHISRLTERFYRVDDSRESTVGGSGLGLAIVKHALERHDSNLTIESKVGFGSTFSFIIPSERCRIH